MQQLSGTQILIAAGVLWTILVTGIGTIIYKMGRGQGRAGEAAAEVASLLE